MTQIPVMGIAPDILHINSMSTPEFRFEYHPKVKKLYAIRVGSLPEIAEPMHDGPVADAQSAKVIVAAFTAGYRAGKREFRKD